MASEETTRHDPASASALTRWLPGAAMLAGYRRAWLRHDLLAGLVLTAVLIPAGMGYAQAAGLPAYAGLFATVVPLIVYAVVGPSRVLVLGPDSALAPIIAATVLPLAAGSTDRAVALAGVLGVLVGAALITAGLVRIGFLADLLSRPIRVGYLTGIAVVVLISQAPVLVGIEVDGGSPVVEFVEFVRLLFTGAVLGPSAIIGLGSLTVIVLASLFGVRAVGVVVAVAGSIVAVAVMGWSGEVAVVGALPRELPVPARGLVGWSDVAALTVPALGIALIALADTSVLSRTFAARRGESVDADAEMRAVGAANVAGGLFGGFPVSASASRTPVAEQAGARSQLAAVVGALLLVAFMFLMPWVTAYLATAALAAVVIVAAASLIDLRGLARLLRMDRLEGALSLAATTGVVVIGVLEGILVAIGLSLVAFVNQSRRPYRVELGRVPGLRGYHDLARNPTARRVPGIAIVRFDAPLFFANGSLFDDFVRDVVRATPEPLTAVVLAAEPITRIDTTAVEELIELDDYLAARGIVFVIAELKHPVRDQLRRYGLESRFGADRLAPTVGAAVDQLTGEYRSDLPEPG
ncbi:MAG TPA: SulP family inorganic anion transporter [Arachnia sp.]|nr:SulP family inorganic anion transporter [Arachnia sp.]HMT86140.1 SulP family inorganic anion transporter [Arachnia sp.]